MKKKPPTAMQPDAPRRRWTPVAVIVAGIALGATAAVLAVELRPHANRSTSAFDGPGTGDDVADVILDGFVASLDEARRQKLADDLETYDRAKRAYAPPPHDGPPRVELWLDVLGARSDEVFDALEDLKRLDPPLAFSMEIHAFPLDGACNDDAPERQDAEHLRCMAARAVECVPRPLRENFVARVARAPRAVTSVEAFHVATESTVTPQRLLSILEELRGGDTAASCLLSADADEALKHDVATATALGINRPPFLLVNGSAAPTDADFLRAIIATRGSGRHPSFRGLPTPDEPRRLLHPQH